MPLTFNVELASKEDRLKRKSVMIRIHMKGHKPGRVLTTVKIEKPNIHWNPKPEWNKWVIKHQYKGPINEEIINEYNRIKNQVETWQKNAPSGELLTPTVLAERFRSGIPTNYFELVEQVLATAKEQAVSTYLGKKTVYNTFKAWIDREEITLDEITATLVREFQEYLKQLPTKMTNAVRKGSSVNLYMSRMHILHREVLIKTGISPKQANFLSPWTDVVKVPEIKPRKGKLQLEKIEAVSKVSIKSNRRKITPEVSFKIWMLANLLAGMRHSDVMQLRYRNFTLNEQGEPVLLRYEMLKTGNRVKMAIFEQAKELLKTWWNDQARPTDYILPYMKNSEPYAKLLTHESYKAAPFEVRKRLYTDLNHWNRQINVCLRQVEEEAGLDEKLRMHNARHSFAILAKRIMKEDSSFTMYDIQKMLGHSNFKTTEVYTDELDEVDTSQAMDAIFNRKRKKED